MKQHVLHIFIDYRGHHKKVLQFATPMKPVYNKNLGFIVSKYILNITERLKEEKH
jgi:hypothetical protein